MTVTGINLQTVDLDNCANERIQSPGSIQPHGVLLVLSLDGTVTHASVNVGSYFAQVPVLGQPVSGWLAWAGDPLREAAQALLEEARLQGDVQPLAIEATLGDRQFDIVVHARAGHVFIELERRESSFAELASFAMMAHRSMSRLKGRTSVDAILAEAVKTVRELTGFDRVMAYRFHADASGEIAAEAKADSLAAYLGRRFPASDIPLQARRLYVVNTLRLIANVNDAQVRIEAFDPSAPPLDMSNAILRSVSPIHVEYLKNINVAASMSVSIVVDGHLWGLIACHHRAAHLVPYAVRMACDILANVVSISVQLLTRKVATAKHLLANELGAKLVELSESGEASAFADAGLVAALERVIASDRIIFSHGSESRHDGIFADAASELLRWLDRQDDDLVALDNLASLPESLRERLSPLCGLLAMRHDRTNRGWLVLMRNEQLASTTWSGPPDKVARIGPLGARLTPDGSLAEWSQDVLGSAEPWDELDRSLARQVMHDVARATSRRAAEMDRARAHLLAILGHDLRDPLNTISMAAAMLEAGVDRSIVGGRIMSTTSRMSRLITQVLDMSRLHGGLGLGLNFVPTDLSAFLAEFVEESRLAHPSVGMTLDRPAELMAQVDRDRLAQVVSNLLSNARQHRDIGTAVMVRLFSEGDRARIVVANVAGALSPELAGCLFDPLTRGLQTHQRNPNGLGLGLYIAHEVMKGHGGTLRYSHDGECVVFSAELPTR